MAGQPVQTHIVQPNFAQTQRPLFFTLMGISKFPNTKYVRLNFGEMCVSREDIFIWGNMQL